DPTYRMANEALLQKLALPAGQIHRMPAEREDRDAAARDYQAEIARVFSVSPQGEPPVFDLVLLGMGPDGHTASLFPHTEALKDTKHRCVAHFVEHSTTGKSWRITLTAPFINRAAEVLILIRSEEHTSELQSRGHLVCRLLL